MRPLTVLFALLLVASATGIAAGSTIQPVGPTSGKCQPGGLFGHVAPEGNALVGVLYPDPATGNECVLHDRDTLAGSTVQIWLYTPSSIPNGTVVIGVEEYHLATHQVAHAGPNGTVIYVPTTYQADVVWSNASWPSAAGEFSQFDLQVPPVFVAPTQAWNLTLEILGLSLPYQIATPGTSLPIPETVGGLIGWLGLMSPIAVVSFVAGFGPGALIVHRLRYVSSGKYAAGFALILSLVIGLGVAVDFTGFLYWLGSVGVLGLGLLLLTPLFVWGAAFWITVRGKRLKSRLVRAPIAKTKGGEPVVGVTAVKIYGGGDTGHPEELVDGLGIGGPRAALHRLLGTRVSWNPGQVAREPRLIHYDWTKGRFELEGEYAVWPGSAGRDIDFKVRPSEVVLFPWRKAVRARYDAAPGEVIDHANDGVKDPALWHHRGFFFGLRHGEAGIPALGSPDHIGPDQYIRGVAPAASFGREAQRLRTSLLLQNEQMSAEAEVLADRRTAIHDRLQSFPGSPEAMEGLRELSTRNMERVFDVDAYLARLEDRGKLRADYRPPGATKWSTSSTSVEMEVREEVPPDLRGKKLERGKKAS